HRGAAGGGIGHHSLGGWRIFHRSGRCDGIERGGLRSTPLVFFPTLFPRESCPKPKRLPLPFPPPRFCCCAMGQTGSKCSWSSAITRLTSHRGRWCFPAARCSRG